MNTPQDYDELSRHCEYLEREIRSLKMTLRDQFAMAALSAFGPFGFGSLSEPENDAARIWKTADAMLEARRLKEN